MTAPARHPDGSPEEPLVSVILPVYQGEALVLRAVASVLGQSHGTLELIVVDDGSTDRTPLLLERVKDPRMEVLRVENGGVARARNLGMARSRGEYLAFLDADDLWHPDFLKEALATARRNGEPHCLVYGWYYAVDDRERLVNLSHPFTASGAIFDDVLRNEGILLPSTTVIHRRVYEALGGFPTDCYHEDRAFFIRACRRFPAFPTGERLVVYRQTPAGRARRVLKDFDEALDAELSIVRSLEPVLDPDETATLERYQMRFLLNRFLMYNRLAHARRLYPRVDRALLASDKKGALAVLSMKTGVDLLYLARVAVQTVTRFALLPWWRRVRKPFYPRVGGLGASGAATSSGDDEPG